MRGGVVVASRGFQYVQRVENMLHGELAPRIDDRGHALQLGHAAKRAVRSCRLLSCGDCPRSVHLICLLTVSGVVPLLRLNTPSDTVWLSCSSERATNLDGSGATADDHAEA